MVFRTAVEDKRGRSNGAIEDEEAVDAVVRFARRSGSGLDEAALEDRWSRENGFALSFMENIMDAVGLGGRGWKEHVGLDEGYAPRYRWTIRQGCHCVSPAVFTAG